MIKQRRCRSIDWQIFVIFFAVAFVLACAITEGLCQYKFAQSNGQSPKVILLSGMDVSNMYCKYEMDGPSAYRRHVEKVIEYAPPSGRGPLVILFSGVNGPDAYRRFAADVAQLGYYAVLLNGLSVTLTQDGEDSFMRAMERAQRSPKAIPGKAAVIGFSLGGGVALAQASHMPDFVSAVIAYYPTTMQIQDMRSFTARFQVPTLVLAGEKDTYMNCCRIESMRAMEAAAKEAGAPFELVAYPNVTHAFNLQTYRSGVFRAETADAWERTTKMLSKYHPLQEQRHR
jgi:dienelactone hydrolase